VLGVAREEQADYTAVDSLANIVFGTAIGGGLHFSAGYIGDRFKARAEAGPLAKTIDSLPHQDQAALMRTAVAQALEGRPIDIRVLMEVAAGNRSPQTDLDFIGGLRREWARDVDNELARITGDRGAGLPTAMAENSPLAQLVARVADETDRGLAGTLAKKIDSLEPDLKAIFPQPEPKGVPALTSEQQFRAAIKEMQADPAKMFEAARSKPEIFKTLAEVADELNTALIDTQPKVIAPEREAAIKEAVAKAQEPHVDKADSDGIAAADQRVADEANVKTIDDEATRMQEEVTELEAYSPEGIEPSQAVKDAAKEASLYARAWKAAAACGMRKA
jgi:hypothetical protein